MLETVKLRGAESGTRESPEPEERSRNDPQTTPRRREERNMVNSISPYHTHTTAELYICTGYSNNRPVQEVRPPI